MKIYSIINHKGGVGKSTMTVNLAAQMSKLGQKVLMIDFDPQANSTSILIDEDSPYTSIADILLQDLEVKTHEINENFHILPSSLLLAKCERMFGGSSAGFFKLKKLIPQLEDKFDIVLIDCPPSLGWLTQNALNASTNVIIPSAPEKFSTDGFDNLMEVIDEVKETSNPNLEVDGIFLNMVRNLRVHTAYVEQIREAYGDMIFTSQIANLKDFPEANASLMPVIEYAPSSKASSEIESLAKEILS
ncbi:ParA family protein [Persicobacter diffluens]|uniref:Chromosome partitioning ATPase n=1 Tax=Persicobacter diffluens TaxID=981 RepID=A0AAN5AQF7_9BACT|nr:chromosome partitioning ATPase [Persicobacter diffluens]